MTSTKEGLRSRVTAASTAVTTQQEASIGRPNTVYSFLTDPKTNKQMTRMLGTEEMAERWLRIALTLCRQTPKLMACTPESFAGALMQCAQLKLEPGPPLGLAWILPYDKNTKIDGQWVKRLDAQFILGYPGIVQLAMRSAQIASIAAHAVCEGDEFRFDYLSNERHHRPPTRGLRGKAIGYYAVAQFANGGTYFNYMSREELIAHRDEFAAAKKFKSGPWYEDADKERSPLFDGMARKTMIRQARPYLPASPDFILATTVDESVIRVDPSGKMLIDDAELETLVTTPQEPTVAIAAAEEDAPPEPATLEAPPDDQATFDEIEAILEEGGPEDDLPL